MNTSTIDKLARQTAATFKTGTGGSQEEVFVDPVTIILFVRILTSVVSAIQECQADRGTQVGHTSDVSTSQLTRMAEYPTPQQHRQLKRIVRRKVGWRRWLLHRRQYLNAIYDTGRQMDDGDTEALFLMDE